MIGGDIKERTTYEEFDAIRRDIQSIKRYILPYRSSYEEAPKDWARCIQTLQALSHFESRRKYPDLGDDNYLNTTSYHMLLDTMDMADLATQADAALFTMQGSSTFFETDASYPEGPFLAGLRLSESPEGDMKYDSIATAKEAQFDRQLRIADNFISTKSHLSSLRQRIGALRDRIWLEMKDHLTPIPDDYLRRLPPNKHDPFLIPGGFIKAVKALADHEPLDADLLTEGDSLKEEDQSHDAELMETEHALIVVQALTELSKNFPSVVRTEEVISLDIGSKLGYTNYAPFSGRMQIEIFGKEWISPQQLANDLRGHLDSLRKNMGLSQGENTDALYYTQLQKASQILADTTKENVLPQFPDIADRMQKSASRHPRIPPTPPPGYSGR